MTTYYDYTTKQYREFNDCLREELDKAKCTYAVLANKAGLSRSAICMLLSGDRRPTRDTVIKIARALNKPIEAFF